MACHRLRHYPFFSYSCSGSFGYTCGGRERGLKGLGASVDPLRDRLRRERRRATLIEYALLISVIALTVLVVIIALRQLG